MELLSLLFMSSCFLTLSGLTFGDQSGIPVIVKEGDDAILPCSFGTNENIEFVRFEWTKEGTEKQVYIHDTGLDHSPALPGRVSHFPDDLQHGSASIRINKVQLEDGGIYTCDFPTRGKTFRIELLVVEPVLKVRNDPGAAEPEITIFVQRNGGALLQCDVKNANPEPTVEWWDSNQIIPSEEPQVSNQGGRFNITLKVTVKKPDRYRCVATQEKINHQAQKEIHVFLNGIPVIVKEGDDAILPCSFGTNENIEFMRFEWTKERTEKQVYIHDTGVAYSPALPGRVSYFPDDLKHGSASIRIKNTQLEDGGIYTCDFTTRGKTFRIELVVEKSVTKVIVKEGDDAILPCSYGTNENITSKLFDWEKEGTGHVFTYNPKIFPHSVQGKEFDRVSHFPGELEHGNASIKINKTRLEDNGTYSCFFAVSGKRFHVQLAVEGILKVQKFQGAAPKPYVTTLKEKGLLECEVPGASPKPTVEWWDSDNKKLPSKTVQDEEEQGRFSITIQTTVTEPGCYHCVATQMEKLHQISSDICVHHDALSWKVAITVTVISVIFGIIGTAFGVCFWCRAQGVL